MADSDPPFYFIDQLLKSEKPKMSFDLSVIRPYRMCPITDKLVGFHSKNEFPVLNICDGSWKSLHAICEATELHWSDSLQQFLVLEYSGRTNQPNRLRIYDPDSGACTQIWTKSPHWNSGWGDNFTTLTCFKEYVLIALGDAIERWVANGPDWFNDRSSTVRWSPPISCQRRGDIR